MVLVLLLHVFGFAQSQNYGQKSYLGNNPVMKYPGIGLFAGGTYFQGDVGSQEIGVIMSAGGIKADYQFNRTLATEINFAGGYLAQKYKSPDLALSDFKATFGQITMNIRLHLDEFLNIKANALFSPYVITGVGYMFFESYVNLYDDDGMPYQILTDGTIADADFNPVQRDNNYETKMDQEDEYPHHTLIIPGGVGVKIKWAEHWESTLQISKVLSFHDHIDGYLSYSNVNGIWKRNEQNQNNDSYILGSFSLIYNFGYNFDRRANRYLPSCEPHFKY